ncbi:MAG: hypothetical protein UY92_C0023G0007 [Candidatus Magasanikbacteria bacterium GW2011_GWA2_56_11]|uniref:Uncharacterized protein n=1 Tax=Candidatus Magasanikbacteria bacterium GW2011_GWA2_56_11 TaxID=1619044 RepID=A0A0G1YCT3_9BACT|nr:MAG: hypothetical protein UY92_C0023G0007 [Candidatus Magasanikbacteria bacterium GW2011_GWA2_56_11]
MLNATELARAAKLGQSRRQAARSAVSDVTRQLKLVREELEYYKQRLAVLARGSAYDPDSAQKILRRLIKLRARQTVILLAKYKEESAITDSRRKDTINDYYRDCSALVRSLERFEQHAPS